MKDEKDGFECALFRSLKSYKFNQLISTKSFWFDSIRVEMLFELNRVIRFNAGEFLCNLGSTTCMWGGELCLP